METINDIVMIFEYVRKKIVPATFLLYKIFVAQLIVEIFDIQKICKSDLFNDLYINLLHQKILVYRLYQLYICK